MRSRLIGRYNAANLLGTLTALLASNVSLEDSVRALERVRPAAGRTECYGGGRRPLVVVDYAHTPEALKSVLNALREIMDSPGRERAACAGRREGRARRRLICLFGCGGERDRGKRPEMAAAAEAGADRVIVTDDNPRGEDGETIVADILAGFRRPGGHRVLRDRRAAIRAAVREAAAGDIVLVAGKGHEPYQEVAGQRLPFDDVAEARAALEARA